MQQGANRRYGGIRSKHPTLAARAALEAARRVSAIHPPEDGDEEDEDEQDDGQRPNFAERFLLGTCLVSDTRASPDIIANEENTFNINDLWVSAAAAQDTAVFEDEDEEMGDTTPGEESDGETPQPSPGIDSFPPNSASLRRKHKQRIVSGNSLRIPSRRFSGTRRFSTASGNVPAIFANTGLHSPAQIQLAEEDNDPFFGTPQSERRAPPLGGLSVIAEGRAHAHERSPLVSPTNGMGVGEKPASTWKSLPLMMIVQVCLPFSSELMAVWSSSTTQHDP